MLIVAGCAAFLGVAIITYWVANRGGYVDKPEPVRTGIGAIARRAAGRPDPSAGADAGAPPADTGAPSAVANASAAPSAHPAPEPTATSQAQAANSADLEEDDPPTPAATPGHPASAPKTTSKKRRRRLKRH